MAEINFNNLYNQLSPMDKRYYDQQFSKNYVPGQENIMLSSQPAYEQMKAVYEAQQQVPEKSFFDFFNFGEASAAEKPQVPNLTYRDITPTFNLATGITNTKAATPFINTADILNQYNVPNLQNRDLVDFIIEQNKSKTVPISYPDVSDAPLRFATDDQASFFFPSDTYTLPLKKPIRESTIDLSGLPVNMGVANEPDVEQVKYLGSEPTGIAKLLQYVPFVGDKSLSVGLLKGLIPKQDPRAINMRNFYGSRYGLTPTGSLASGIMAGYNPISGGFLNFISGGKYGKPTQYGLADAARKRIQKIATRKAPQTEASRRKIAELQRFAEADTISRARQAAPDVYRDAGRKGRLGPGGGFSTSGREGAFSSKSGRGRQDY